MKTKQKAQIKEEIKKLAKKVMDSKNERGLSWLAKICFAADTFPKYKIIKLREDLQKIERT
jgi:hypothetical protein